MDIVKLSNRRVGALFAAGLLLFATMLPALASAATVTSRSIALSSSVTSAQNVTYDVDFNAATDSTGAFAIDFCTTPDIGAACTTPTGFDIATIGTSSGHTVTEVDSNTAKVVLSTSVDDGDPVAVDITGITNPSGTGVFYARIVTYTDGTTNYFYTAADDLDDGGNHLDDGSVAMSITDGFDVSGSVLETLVFCVSGDDGLDANPITSGCGGTLTSPDLSLGTDGVLSTTASEDTIFTQLSTNAAGGATVSLRSDATECGGLVREGATNSAGCGIAPITTTGVTSISAGAAQVGMKLGDIATDTGTIQGVGNYNTTDYHLGYVIGDASGVTGPYGENVMNTNGAPVSDGDASLTFGANISNVTPAGRYSASMSLIATGTF